MKGLQEARRERGRGVECIGGARKEQSCTCGTEKGRFSILEIDDFEMFAE